MAISLITLYDRNPKARIGGILHFDSPICTLITSLIYAERKRNETFRLVSALEQANHSAERGFVSISLNVKQTRTKATEYDSAAQLVIDKGAWINKCGRAITLKFLTPKKPATHL
uniref:SFRICE_008390 n=1 Tax=Spodoptera frugiperda TaxID=7108 RepID=A0A2H1VI61_SPOFR